MKLARRGEAWVIDVTDIFWVDCALNDAGRKKPSWCVTAYLRKGAEVYRIEAGSQKKAKELYERLLIEWREELQK